MRKPMKCERCIRGQVMWFRDEPACINCGWHPAHLASSYESPYSKVLRKPVSMRSRQRHGKLTAA